MENSKISLKPVKELLRTKRIIMAMMFFLEYNNINYFWSSDDCIYTFDIDKGTKSKNKILEKASKINAYGIIDKLKTYNYS